MSEKINFSEITDEKLLDIGIGIFTPLEMENIFAEFTTAIKQGEDLSEVRDFGTSFLHIYALSLREFVCFDKLFETHPPKINCPDVRDAQGRNALHYAALSGSVIRSEKLLELGVPTDSEDANGVPVCCKLFVGLSRSDASQFIGRGCHMIEMFFRSGMKPSRKLQENMLSFMSSVEMKRIRKDLSHGEEASWARVLAKMESGVLLTKTQEGMVRNRVTTI